MSEEAHMDKQKDSGSRISCVAFTCLLLLSARVDAAVESVEYQAQGNYLIVEVLDDDLIHFEYGAGAGPGVGTPIEMSDMICTEEDGVPAAVCGTSFSGPTEFGNDGAGGLDTKEVRIAVDQHTLAVSIIDKTKNNVVLTTLRSPPTIISNFAVVVGCSSAVAG